ncbi:ATP-dependent DNA helicase [Clostridium baratii]|uniref:HelD family protein n=1 Tax=Clostridium baratii TaxID=1561 RepID=UPI0009A34468|nr:UvrD-helicase domain-containing protein [Clostridium baratii]OPF50601.1 ATP-dependent DNA helicase [Clostridium baratii]OPF54155.1 ATP-dependent DNA helicase [Clostridium baratii]OPF58719.1 ATP-dependent DNA helicase [Clostridium baratii]OPF58909.1 ATP-dependent DNA helicase [Clostridium baratii]
MNNNLDFLTEEKHLNQTISLLNEEILNYINKRKYITEYIVDYRKKVIEEYRDDEDKILEYFDHEAYVKEEAYKSIDKKLKEYTILKESPYFGKVTFIEDGDRTAEEIYIGRFGLTKEGSFEPVIVDWRAPIASLFYKGTLGKSSYESPVGEIEADILGRRQLIVKRGELKGVFDSALDVKDEILQMVLTNNSSDKLKDIVMTIQEEQDEIIRAPKDKVVVVNGVAGSGKTTIALHRVSYLLYNFRKQFGDKVLILGPNDIFMDYINGVLPSLGEDGIDNMTFESFAIKEIGLKENFTEFSYYIEKAMQGDEKSLLDYKEKSSKSFAKELDKKVQEMNENYFNIKPVIFDGEEIVSKEEIKELFDKHYAYMPLFRRSEKIKRILISKIKDKRDEYVWKLNKDIEEKIKSIKEEDLIFEKNNLDFQRRLRIREIIRYVMNARDELNTWILHEDVVDIYKKATNTTDLGYMDLAGILYLMIKLEGKKSKKEYKHVVIDEAQDYNFMQFEVIKELTGSTSYTIVGDSNQRLIETDEKPAMTNLDTIFERSRIMNFSLNKSYRSTQEIMEYASKFLKEERIVPLVRNGEKVLEEETENMEETIDTINSIIEDYEEEGLESIAVITKNKEELKEISHRLKEKVKILTFDRNDIIYNGGKVLIPAYYAKGLEFDGVIILENENNTPDLVNYIMCTRALHRLSIIKTKNIL